MNSYHTTALKRANGAVYVDEHGEMHDPDYQMFPSFPSHNDPCHDEQEEEEYIDPFATPGFTEPYNESMYPRSRKLSSTSVLSALSSKGDGNNYIWVGISEEGHDEEPSLEEETEEDDEACRPEEEEHVKVEVEEQKPKKERLPPKENPSEIHHAIRKPQYEDLQSATEMERGEETGGSETAAKSRAGQLRRPSRTTRCRAVEASRAIRSSRRVKKPSTIKGI
ncbi:hypothetical protein BDZ89DRAFT_1035137 [Hymenopellis radicata]|nr:hypothetical protein BDZ89DRAFT_1035137 [Hymenopellis radicata]